MRLLVSVQNVEEARLAHRGGADIIDAKDPARGALGPVRRSVLREIRAALPDTAPVSAALGDVAAFEEVRGALDGLPAGLTWVKLGFAGVANAATVEVLLREAVRRAAELPGTPGVIAVAYADRAAMGEPSPEVFPALLARTGAQGLLVDTSRKDGRTLRDHLAPGALVTLGARLAEAGLLFALGGSLTAADIPLVRAAGAGILGVRGAVTSGDRAGPIEADRVVRLAEQVRAGSAPLLR